MIEPAPSRRSVGSASLLRRRLPAWVPIGLAASGLLVVLWFDFGPNLAFNDDWSMAWGARQLIQHGRLRVFPEQSALALTQNVWSALVTFGKTDQAAFRLSNYPWVVATAVLIYAIARRLGANRFWSGVASATLLASPVYDYLGVSYMTEPAYIAILCAAAYCGIRWMDGTRWRLAFVILVGLATLQRQIGLVIPLALLASLLLSRQRLFSRDHLPWLIAALLVAAAAIAVPSVANLAPPTQGNRLSGLARVSIPDRLLTLAYLGPQFGFYLSPLGLPLLLTSRPRRPQGALPFALRVIGGIGLTLVVILVITGATDQIFPPTIFGARGLLPGLEGQKPHLFPERVMVLIAGLVAITIVALIWRADLLQQSRTEFRKALLLTLSLFHFLPLLLLQTQAFDRYFLVAAVPMIPLLAAFVSKADLSTVREGSARLAAIGVVVLGMIAFAAAEQDYQAWQVARDDAARLAYTQAPPDQVDAGYEANAVYVEVPRYDATGYVSGGLVSAFGDYGFPVHGPLHPAIRLEFAPTQDGRQGVVYRSLSPGKLVLVPVPSP